MLALQALTTTGGRESEAFNVISITGMARPSDGSHSISEKYQRIHTREECLPLSQDAFVTSGVKSIGSNWEEAWDAIQDLQCAGDCPYAPSQQITRLEMLTLLRLTVLY